MARTETLITEKRFCKGPDGTIRPGIKIQKIHQNNMVIIMCPNKNDTDGCRTDEKRCIFNYKGFNLNDPNTCVTDKGVLLLDVNGNQITQSPSIPAKHDPIPLTPLQTQILSKLAQYQGVVVGYKELPTTRSNLKKNISELNTLLKNPKKPSISQDSLIKNVTDEGYFIPSPDLHYPENE